MVNIRSSIATTPGLAYAMWFVGNHAERPEPCRIVGIANALLESPHLTAACFDRRRKPAMSFTASQAANKKPMVWQAIHIYFRGCNA